jgi:hypothetical protein
MEKRIFRSVIIEAGIFDASIMRYAKASIRRMIVMLCEMFVLQQGRLSGLHVAAAITGALLLALRILSWFHRDNPITVIMCSKLLYVKAKATGNSVLVTIVWHGLRLPVVYVSGEARKN